ncbi:hypothetical protein HMPREF9098_1379 [Kingella denitrificans ATCC 33394]|uniref:Uncharacterized protein n=1 Tax=Kingella denitrificans ATCC 33394 TaxID=888741 RepID=F0EZU5_9NEIS|nr:hypothetical protein HMPREF9098_1379 [Kingella denitrificans ATCC 33394]
MRLPENLKSSLHFEFLKCRLLFIVCATLFPRLSDSTKSRFDLP